MFNFIDAHLAWCRAGGLRTRTVHDREYVLQRMDQEIHNGDLCDWPGGHGIADASDVEIEHWFGNDRWGAWTRLTWFNHAWAFFTWAEGRYLDINPMAGMRRPKAPPGVPRPIDDEHLAHILGNAAEPFRLFAVLAALAGLRCCEIARLRREDVTEQRLIVREGKGGKPAVLETNAELWAAVRDFPHGSITQHAGGVPDARWVSIRSTLHYQKKLHLPRGVSLHPVRHWYAKECRRRGADAITLQSCMRHARLSTTENYFQAGEAERRPVMTALRLPAAA